MAKGSFDAPLNTSGVDEIGDLARSLTPYVTEVTGADHGMLVPGPLAGSRITGSEKRRQAGRR